MRMRIADCGFWNQIGLDKNFQFIIQSKIRNLKSEME